MEYSQVVEQVMESKKVSSLLTGGEVMEIAVVGTGGVQSEGILATLQACTAWAR